MNNYWIYYWAKLRQDEVIRIPLKYNIHSDFTYQANEYDVQNAFEEINALYKQIYGDIAENPAEFGMPLHLKEQNRVFSQQWRETGLAPFRPFVLLYNLFVHGKINNTPKYHAAYLVVDGYIRNADKLFNKLTDYGFTFEGLKNNKPTADEIIISYPDNPLVLTIWKALAEKTKNVCTYSNAGYPQIGDFLFCNFRLLQDGFDERNYGDYECFYDNVSTEEEKAFICEMDKTIIDMGLFRIAYGGVEGAGLAYYRNKKSTTKDPYTFRIILRDFDDMFNFNSPNKMRISLRIRNADNCLEYLESCPDSVKQIFEKTDKGCKKRIEKSCIHGINYKLNGKEYWRCGCCHTSFYFYPKIEDITHYIKLVELGEKK